VTFGQALKKERTARGLSQEALGKKAGISGIYVCRIEKGHEVPTYDRAVKLAKAVGMPEIVRLLKVCPTCKQPIRKKRKKARRPK